MDSVTLGLTILLCAASALPIWLLLARSGLLQNSRLTACVALPFAVCFALVFSYWLASNGGGSPDPAELRGWRIVGFIIAVLVAAVPGIAGFGIGFLLESRYGGRAP